MKLSQLVKAKATQLAPKLKAALDRWVQNTHRGPLTTLLRTNPELFKTLPVPSQQWLFRSISLPWSKLRQLVKGKTFKSAGALQSWSTKPFEMWMADTGAVNLTIRKAVPLKQRLVGIQQLKEPGSYWKLYEDFANEHEVICQVQSWSIKDAYALGKGSKQQLKDADEWLDAKSLEALQVLLTRLKRK